MPSGEAIGFQPKNLRFVNGVAWLLATSPEASLRDGPQAVALAKRVVEISGGKDPAIFDTLAAACAEANQFPQAVTAAGRAIALAQSAHQTDLAQRIQTRLDLYRAGRPYRESPAWFKGG